MDIYDADRIAPKPVPPGFKDDVGDAHFVPAPCQVACPIGTDAPSYIAYIWEGKIEEAFEAITATNPFSSICGRVCDAPCEPACRRADSDGPIAIRNLKRYVMDKLGRDYRLPLTPVTRPETVGIVGSGPAGLTAAQDLAEAGFEVHVYEMTDRLGGMMVWGIPAFRLPPGIIEEDLERMLSHCPGIKVHLNCTLGRDVTLDQLKARHDALLLTIGSWWGKTAEVAGDDDSRVVDGVAFLRRINAGERPEMPETVLVVGGGDVAMDACRVARRLPGCKTVKVVYRRGPEQIPARRDELEGALKEGIEVIYNTQPVAVVADGDRFALRCVATTLGKPETDGRRRPVNLPGSERDLDCGLVIMAVGQKAESAELDRRGMMAGERVRTDWETMRTGDRKVFAAGDGAFGGSTIVMAMHHGHRAAYYIKAFLDGREDPLPYRTPFRTRRVPVAQDPDWEVFAREHQHFHGVGKNPVAFPEIESTYDQVAAKKEAARCYRCDAETGSADYSVKMREDIFVMARSNPADARTQRQILRKRLLPRDNPFPAELAPTLEDLVFLPANLSRLVIDPYRDACNIKSRLGGVIDLALPFIAAGFDEAASEIRDAVAHGLAEQGCGYLGKRQLSAAIPWLQLVADGAEPDASAAALVYAARGGFKPIAARRVRDGQLLGLTASRGDLPAAIPFALEQGFDLLVLEGNPGLVERWPELGGAPDLAVIRDAVRLMRAMNREEDLALVYFGGVRSGTDAAKLISLGANAVVLGVSMAFALGGAIEGGGMTFSADRSLDERKENADLFLKALSAEASIMARCTGKTNVFNLEPEDLRSITIATARAAGVPLAGTRAVPAAQPAMVADTAD